jgi:3',5'-cyclic AMP phosphodiesterase CpdA
MKFAKLSGAGAVAAIALLAATAGAADPLGLTTVDQRIVPTGATGFDGLTTGPGEGYVVREEGVGTAQAGRAERRASIAYFGQLSDFQLADEESPARVEFLDIIGPPVEGAHRPSEALNPHVDDAMVRQVNEFADASPVAAGDGSTRPMDFVINTGDLADSQQFNETEWVRTLLEGGTLEPGSGIDPTGYTHPLCPPVGVPGAAEAAAYTGVQDYDDYNEGEAPFFYDPDDPRGAFADWPEYTGLMDRAQQSFEAAGLEVPSYVAFGNHDALVQGNQAANATFEAIATGCVKVTAFMSIDELLGLDQEKVEELLGEGKATLVPPDPDRRYVSKEQYKEVFIEGEQDDGHGFGEVDPAEETASNGAAGYYSFSPEPGLRMISVDTVCEGGLTGPCSDGNVDDPQFKWLEAELEEATAADELVVLYSHHAIPSLTANVADEVAPACSTTDPHGHDVNPGCDVDPRNSAPIHLGDEQPSGAGESMVSLLHRFPHVIAWVAGHSHVNSIEPYVAPGGEHGFWSVRVAAEADWPQQTRLLELFDNEDGTLSLFGTIVDHVGEVTAPAPGSAAAFTTDQLASVGRTIAYNDPQKGGRACEPDPCGEGTAQDRNVELLIADPRIDPPAGPGPGPVTPPADEPKPKGKAKGKGKGKAKGQSPARCSNRVVGTNRGELLRGTPGQDLILGRGGRDRITPRGSEDCVFAGRGNDRVFARGGGKDRIRCGRGRRDVAVVDGRDSVKGCERVRRPRRR